MTPLMSPGSRVYVAHIEGTPFEDMLAAARRLAAEGFAVMPHFPARIIDDAAQLEEWIKAYAGEAGVTQALVLAGGTGKPLGAFHSSMQLLETGLFEKHGYTRLHVAGHPEGNKDIDPHGGTAEVDAAVRWKQDYARQTGTEMALVTQFAFDAAPVIAWAERLAADGITLPIHVGIAGPAKLQTLIKFAIACGVGPIPRCAAEAREGFEQAAPSAGADRCRHGARRPQGGSSGEPDRAAARLSARRYPGIVGLGWRKARLTEDASLQADSRRTSRDGLRSCVIAGRPFAIMSRVISMARSARPVVSWATVVRLGQANSAAG